MLLNKKYILIKQIKNNNIYNTIINYFSLIFISVLILKEIIPYETEKIVIMCILFAVLFFWYAHRNIFIRIYKTFFSWFYLLIENKNILKKLEDVFNKNNLKFNFFWMFFFYVKKFIILFSNNELKYSKNILLYYLPNIIIYNLFKFKINYEFTFNNAFKELYLKKNILLRENFNNIYL